MVRAAAFFLILPSLLWLTPSSSEACSCYSPAESFVAPAENATGVPVNTKIWAGRVFDRPVQLFELEGALVPTTETAIDANDSELVVLTPNAPLNPGQRYRFESSRGTIVFTVAEGRDDEAPPIPSEVGRETHSEGPELFGSSSCGNSGYYAIE